MRKMKIWLDLAFIHIQSQLLALQWLVSSSDASRASVLAEPPLCHVYRKGACLLNQRVKMEWHREQQEQSIPTKRITEVAMTLALHLRPVLDRLNIHITEWLLWTVTPVTGSQTEVASEWQCCPAGILLQRDVETIVGQWEKLRASPKWPQNCDKELTAPEDLCYFFARGIFTYFIMYIQKPKISFYSTFFLLGWRRLHQKSLLLI